MSEIRKNFLTPMHPTMIKGNSFTFLLFLLISSTVSYFNEKSILYFIPVLVFSIWSVRIFIDPYKHQVEHVLYGALMGMTLSLSLLKHSLNCFSVINIEGTLFNVIITITYLAPIILINLFTAKIVENPRKISGKNNPYVLGFASIAPGLGYLIGQIIMLGNPSQTISYGVLASCFLVLAIIMSFFSVGVYKYVYMKKYANEIITFKK